MKEMGIRARQKKKYKATADSNHSLPVAENHLKRNFTAFGPNQHWVSDITYKNLDIFKDAPTSLGAGFKAAMVHELDFQGMKEAFHNSVIPTIPFATHGADHAVALQQAKR